MLSDSCQNWDEEMRFKGRSCLDPRQRCCIGPGAQGLTISMGCDWSDCKTPLGAKISLTKTTQIVCPSDLTSHRSPIFVETREYVTGESDPPMIRVGADGV